MAILGVVGAGEISALLIIFFIRVISLTIGYRLFSFPKIFCPNSCSWVFLVKVITLFRKASRERASTLARLVLSSSSNAVVSAII